MKKWIAFAVAMTMIALLGWMLFHYRTAKPTFSEENLQLTISAVHSESIPEETDVSVPSWNIYTGNRELLAQQYFVYDCTAGKFLTLSGEETERIYPASITKLFTAYVAMQYLLPDTEITAGEALDLVVWGSSVAKIEKGDVLTAGQLVEAMLLPSGNDAAYLLACAAGRVIQDNPALDATAAVEIFIEEMNRQAAVEGMTGTHFVNPDGIHDGNHYTNFVDLAILGKLAMENPTIMEYARTPEKEVALHGEKILWKNTNRLIHSTSPYYCPYAVGLKTGQTPAAGSCLLAAFRIENTELLIGVFGCPEETDRFDDALHLFWQWVLKS